MRFLVAVLGLMILGGCTQSNVDEPTPPEGVLFGPAAMRIHPIFTQVKDWTSDDNLDGIEALIEFQDQFGDPTKAAGTVMFELYDYKPGGPDVRGMRLVNPWIGSIVSEQEQRSRWNRTSRTYTFQLAYPTINRAKSYVLTAVFRSNTGGRFFDRVVLEGQPPEEVTPTTKPTTKPSKSGLFGQ